MAPISRVSGVALLAAVLLPVACTDEAAQRLAELSSNPRFVYAKTKIDGAGAPKVDLFAATLTEADEFYVIATQSALSDVPLESPVLTAAPDGSRYLLEAVEPIAGGGLDIWVQVLTPDLESVIAHSDDSTASAADQGCDGAALALELFEVQDFLDSEISFGALNPGATAVVHPGSSSRPLGDGAGWLSSGDFYVTLRERLEFDVVDPEEGTLEAYGRTRQEVVYYVTYGADGDTYGVTSCSTLRPVNAIEPARLRDIAINEDGFLTLDGALLVPEIDGFAAFLGPDVADVAGPHPLRP